MASHLTTLIKRVKSVPHKLRTETSTFTCRLVNLAEYLRYENDYSDFEKNRAMAILKAHKLDFLLEPATDDEFEKKIKEIETFKEKGLSRTCIRCGRTLTLNDSIVKGYGAECYSKRVMIGNEKLDKFFDDERFEAGEEK